MFLRISTSCPSAALTFFHNYMPGKGYNNIYCYLCNKQAAVTCDLEGIEKSTGSLVFLLNGGPLMETEMEDDNKGKEVCGHAEVFDTFFVCIIYATLPDCNVLLRAVLSQKEMSGNSHV